MPSKLADFTYYMLLSAEKIQEIALDYFDLTATVKQLPGEIDLNYQLTTPAGAKYTLKLAHPDTSLTQLEFQHALMRRLHEANLGLEIPQVVSSKQGAPICQLLLPDGTQRLLRLLSWVEGRCLADVNPHTPQLLEQVGVMCGKLSRALEGFDHPEAHRYLKWDPAQAAWTATAFQFFSGTGQQELAQYFFGLFETAARELLPHLRKSVCYCDANDYNVLISHDVLHPLVPGVIDFGDAVYTHTVNDLAIACAYAALHKPDPMSAVAQVVKGYHQQYPLREQEAAALFPLIGARLLISVSASAVNRAEHPENEYLQISDQAAWKLLQKLRKTPPALATATIRQACGWEPCPLHAAFVEWASKRSAPMENRLIDAPLDSAYWLDLSVGSPGLGNYADIEDAARLHQNIMAQFPSNGLKDQLGIGRYDETRPFYTTDAYEVRGNDGPEWRSVHIGLDVFLPPGTPVYAPLDGVIHSFHDNAQDRDYGPTIILQHQVSEKLTFYTLYGHLTRQSLIGKTVGQPIAAGDTLCAIGPMPENGNWSPHLHFQVILDIMGWQGDFPGVAFPRTKDIWKSFCPDPWLLLTGNYSPPAPARMPAQDILAFRQKHLGKNLSVSYQNPLHMQRGWRQYLFDDTGRRYLDTVNNVAHVGHEHPRVVQAGQRQMAVLNTNTRYLHEYVVRFTEELLSTFPPGLDVAFIVNSGSEANELAMRLAKNYTQQQDMLVVEAGYHGNTQGCVDISSYKFEGPGGKGAPAHTHVSPLPDAYRGLYRGQTNAVGLAYAQHVGAIVQQIVQSGRGVAAFICESVISCGGQIPLPLGYLSEAVRQVRAAGGLYIADEVQTGCARHGQYFWAFEEHGVVPDIVTVGKPIGNGHPLGVVVTTQAIADAFANGMEYFNTYGGNPVACAIGLEVLRVIREEGLQQNAFETGQYLKSGLEGLSKQFPVIGDVRGQGLFLGFELIAGGETLQPAPAQASYLANRMRELGVLMSTDGPDHNVIKIKPPMVFSRKDSDFLLEMLTKVLDEDPMKIA